MVAPALLRRSRRVQRGFQLVEVLIAMMVLVIAMVGLVGTQVAASKGLNASGSFANALDVASQRAEALAAQGVASLPAGCAPSFGYTGCLAAGGGFAGPEACTAFVDGPDIPLPNSGVQAVSALPKFRVDTIVQLPPDANQQNASPTPPSVLSVFVCWQEQSGLFRMVQTSRLMMPTTRGQ